ncbi:MAG: diguanylate cyclase, partial [Anaerolineaceae bacterium]|nr:diguanylate cyclase [Anaerolineaceae bacterium]
LLLLPMIIGDELIGLVGCHIKRPKRYFTDEEIDLASSIANLAAVRIEQARIYDEERKQVSSLALLHATSLDISKSHNNPDLLKTIVKRAAWLLNATGGSLYLYNQQKGELVCNVSHNCPYSEEGGIVGLGEGAAGKVAESKQALVVDDYMHWEHSVLNTAEVEVSFGLLTVPVIFQENMTGVLQVFRTDLHHPFTTQDTDLLSLFSNQVAISLENARLYEEVQQVAIRDSLTGLYNRRGLFEVAEREILRAQRYQRPLAVCLLDIDHFKTVNDTYGHPVGDEVLAKLANTIRQNLRGIDFVGRYGGEEFIILAVENDIKATGRLADRVCRMIAARPVSTSAGGVSITVSIGVAELSEHIRDLPALLQAADQALYLAKHSGRNQVQYFIGTLAGT